MTAAARSEVSVDDPLTLRSSRKESMETGDDVGLRVRRGCGQCRWRLGAVDRAFRRAAALRAAADVEGDELL